MDNNWVNGKIDKEAQTEKYQLSFINYPKYYFCLK